MEEQDQTPVEEPQTGAADAADELTDDSRQPAEAEAPAQEAPAAETPAEEPAADAEAPTADREPSTGEPQGEPVHPKQRRKSARSQHTGEVRPPRTPEERASERSEARSRRAAARRSYRQKQREKRAGAPRAATPQIEGKEHGPGRPRVRQGVVVSAKPDKTITVRIDVARRHRAYKKIVRSSSTLHAHDERNEAHEGDTVRVIESRPLSRTKRWRLVEILERAR